MSPLSGYVLMQPYLIGAGYVVAMCVSIKLGIVKQLVFLFPRPSPP